MSRIVIIDGLEPDLPTEELQYEAEQWASPNEIHLAEQVLGIDKLGNIRIIKHPELRTGQLAGRAIDAS